MDHERIVPGALLACLLLVAPVIASESQQYVGASGDVVVLCPVNPCVGGGHFVVPSNGTSVEIDIHDLVNDDVGGGYAFLDASGQTLAKATFCGSAIPQVPEGSTELWVHVFEANGPLVCDVADAWGTTGFVQVAWTTS